MSRASQSKVSFKKNQFKQPFFVADFDENGPFIRLGSEMGFNDRVFHILQGPVVNNVSIYAKR
jgi:hypothetical protein